MTVVSGILGRIQSEILWPAMLVIFSVGFLLFVWGLVKFMYNLEEGGGSAEGKEHMLWGIIGMFVMVSIWSIIGLIDNTFGLGVLNGNGAATDPSRNQMQNLNFGGPR